MYLLWKNVHSGLVRISLLLNQVLFFFVFILSYVRFCVVWLLVLFFVGSVFLDHFCSSAVASPLLVLCLMFSLIGPVCLFWFLVPLPEGTDPKRYC